VVEKVWRGKLVGWVGDDAKKESGHGGESDGPAFGNSKN